MCGVHDIIGDIMIKRFLTVSSMLSLLLAMNTNLSQAETLVPIDEYIAKTTHTYTTNADKSEYTINVPHLRVAGDYVYMDNALKSEPIKLPIIQKDGQQYVDLDLATAVLGVTYTVNNGVVTVNAAPIRMEKRTSPEMKGPVSWAFDPFTTTPYSGLMNTSGDNIISPSWFELQDKGLKLNKNINASYVQTYRDQGYRVWPLISNQFDPKFTSTVVNNESKWDAYVQQLAQYAYIYGFDGYNFDFENVSYKDRDALTKFVAYLADTLRTYNIRTSIDVTGYSDSPDWSMVYNRKAFSESVDYVVLMAYDETWASSTKAGPVASYPWVKRHATDMLKEVPANKLVLGIPYYMRIWTVTDGKAKGKTLQIKDTPQYYENYKDQITWNDTLKTHFLEIPVSVAAKAQAEQDSLEKQAAVINEAKEAGDIIGVEVQVLSTNVVSTNASANNITATTSNSTMTDNDTAGNKTTTTTPKKITGSKVVEQIWFEDNNSLGYKLDLVKDLKLAGFAAWRKGFEDANTLDLISKANLGGKHTSTSHTDKDKRKKSTVKEKTKSTKEDIPMVRVVRTHS